MSSNSNHIIEFVGYFTAMTSSLDDLVPTLSSRIRNQSKSSTPPVVEVVEFKAYKRKSKALEDDPADDQLTAKKKDEVVDMKKARFEIMKFGMNRMTGREKEKTKDIIAIELGKVKHRLIEVGKV